MPKCHHLATVESRVQSRDQSVKPIFAPIILRVHFIYVLSVPDKFITSCLRATTSPRTPPVAWR